MKFSEKICTLFLGASLLCSWTVLAQHETGSKPAGTFPTGVDPYRLSRSTNGPLVRFLQPGFIAEELPIELTAINNLEYDSKGRLFAAGYDGRIHLIRDTNGDHLEDQVTTFSSQTSEDYPLGMVVHDGMPHLLLSDELVRYRDTNGDGIPDQREIVLKQWDDPDLRTNNLILHRRVDSALGLARGKDGSWYLTMGSANPGNGYWQKIEGNVWNANSKKSGPPQYNTERLRGVLLRFHPDGRMEKLATGLRYIMSMQFNESGDLFGTDQEGATWLPNGNPFDEFLHLQKGRHYGFPPRHPLLLPNVVDEPSTFDYAPQHQSTCGFRFNGPADGRGRFGPPHWAKAAIVTGAARGKLWRTSLAKATAGYVARSELIAQFGMIVVDCAISPRGELVVACHDGPPDWGKGPSAKGKLVKIRWTGKSAPSPILVAPVSAEETAIIFDRKLTGSIWETAALHVSVEGGRNVFAADRFEPFRPGYAVVKMQENEPRYRWEVSGIQNGRSEDTLIVRTPPRSLGFGYAITLEQMDRLASRKDEGSGNILDVAFDLSGVQAELADSRGKPVWKGWLPSADLLVSKEFTQGSLSHEEFWKKANGKGALTISGQLDLSNLLQPRTQPGSTLDYTPPLEIATIHFTSDAPVEISSPGAEVKKSAAGTDLTLTVIPGRWQPFTLRVATPVKKLDVAFTTKLDQSPRPLALHRMLMPFARRAPASSHTMTIPEIAGGNRERGRDLFFGRATCGSCHQVQGKGFAVGPDLSNSFHRDYASLMKDIVEPSATINPDAVAYIIHLKNGESVTGVRQSETELELNVIAAGGLVTKIAKNEIVRREPQRLSLMPEGLLQQLSKEEVRDLLTFLLQEPAAE
jgi:putative heme-binding domain-containing protein